MSRSHLAASCSGNDTVDQYGVVSTCQRNMAITTRGYKVYIYIQLTVLLQAAHHRGSDLRQEAKDKPGPDDIPSHAHTWLTPHKHTCSQSQRYSTAHGTNTPEISICHTGLNLPIQKINPESRRDEHTTANPNDGP